MQLCEQIIGSIQGKLDFESAAKHHMVQAAATRCSHTASDAV